MPPSKSNEFRAERPSTVPSPSKEDASVRPSTVPQSIIEHNRKAMSKSVPGTLAGAYSITDMKMKFHEMDLNQDGMLSFEELWHFLKRGRPDITEAELSLLYLSLDHDKNTLVDFDEFVDFVYSSRADHEPSNWNTAKRTFTTFAEHDFLSLKHWVGMCYHVELLDDAQFGLTDAEHLFHQVQGMSKSYKGIDFKQFQKLIKLVAKRKDAPLNTVVAWIASFAPGHANQHVLAAEKAAASDTRLAHKHDTARESVKRQSAGMPH
mmetsp:Transcript_60119/g.106929  ORF Transcript_60119/g.106929 Transcript_60119/m.106929 type:complete len:264 (-) Transcript_60119:121-912(-)